MSESKCSLRLIGVAALAVWMMAACKGGVDSPPSATVRARAGEAGTIEGAGASFPYPVYAQWAYAYHGETGLKINYQSIGSGGGIAQIKAKTVDYGASDAPLEKADLDAAGLIQFPMVMGGVVPVFNLPGVGPGDLKISRGVLAGIFLGEVTRWDDEALAALNPDADLPGRDITVVHRADGSGTTWIFTSFLSKVSTGWSDQVGTGKAVSWPTGVGGKGNEGVATNVQRIKGAIGYVEFAYALQNEMAWAWLDNRAGNYVAPTIETFQAAAAGADWENAPGFHMVLTDQPGDRSWPITGASFILLHKDQPDRKKAQAMLDFFSWCYEHGQEKAVDLHYVPIPTSVVGLVEGLWAKHLRAGGEAVWRR